jgi:hypothetical protein
LLFLIVSGLSVGVVALERPLALLAGAGLLTAGWLLLRKGRGR